MTATKYCENCKFCEPPTNGKSMEYARCRKTNPGNHPAYMVSEKFDAPTQGSYCQRVRENHHLCGEGAGWFEAKTVKQSSRTTPRKIELIVCGGPTVSLASCPIGLFLSSSGTLCLKTEYGNNEGRIDAYIVSSGEFFRGAAPKTNESQGQQQVTPVIVSGDQ